MTQVSQRCQYALRALFELAKRYGQGPTRSADVAGAQAIPVRFLEVILGQLRQGGFVVSRRGMEGGYILARDPAELSVGEVIRFVEGPLSPVQCAAGAGADNCPLYGRCAFMGMWEQARDAVAGVYDSTSFRGLLEAEAATAEANALSYCI